MRRKNETLGLILENGLGRLDPERILISRHLRVAISAWIMRESSHLLLSIYMHCWEWSWLERYNSALACSSNCDSYHQAWGFYFLVSNSEDITPSKAFPHLCKMILRLSHLAWCRQGGLNGLLRAKRADAELHSKSDYLAIF